MKITFGKKFATSACAVAVSMGIFAPAAQAAEYDSMSSSLLGSSSSLLGSSLPNLGSPNIPNIPLPNIPNIPSPNPNPNQNPSPRVNVDQVKSQIVNETNNFRINNDPDPVIIKVSQNSQIQNGAQAWADEMARTGVVKHDPHIHDVNSSLYENIHITTNPNLTAKGVVNSWAGSPGHRKNMLAATNQMGVGIARGSNGTWYVVARYKYDFNTNDTYLRNKFQ